MFVVSCVPWIASGWGILYFSLSALENQLVPDSKQCTPAEAMLNVATTVHLIYLGVNAVLKFIDCRDKIEKALHVVVTALMIIIIAAFVHLEISNHVKSMCCTGTASLAMSGIYTWRCFMVGNPGGIVALSVGFMLTLATTIIALTLSKPSLE